MEQERMTADRVCEEQFAPIRAWAHKNHGTIAEIAKRLRKRTGSNLTRQTVGRWLHNDPTRRQQPSYGWGLLLIEVVRELQTEEQS